MPVILLAKTVISVAAGLGVNRVVAEVIKNNTAVVTTADKVLVTAGSLAFSSMAVEATGNHITRMFNAATSRVKTTTDEEVAEAA